MKGIQKYEIDFQHKYMSVIDCACVKCVVLSLCVVTV